MRLSEAIRLGSMMSPQCFGYLYRGGGSCVMGAALAAIDRRYGLLRDTWPWTRLRTDVRCPECGLVEFPYGTLDVSRMLAHLNDDHRWSRERIADWVESIEPDEAVPVENSLAETPAEPVCG